MARVSAGAALAGHTLTDTHLLWHSRLTLTGKNTMASFPRGETSKIVFPSLSAFPPVPSYLKWLSAREVWKWQKKVGKMWFHRTVKLVWTQHQGGHCWVENTRDAEREGRGSYLKLATIDGLRYSSCKRFQLHTEGIVGKQQVRFLKCLHWLTHGWHSGAVAKATHTSRVLRLILI